MFLILLCIITTLLYWFWKSSYIRPDTIGGGYWSTWYGTCSGYSSQVFVPNTREDLLSIVQNCVNNGKKLRVIGSGHSWNKGVGCRDVLVSLEALNRVVEVDKTNMLVTVEGGCKINALNSALEAQGLALSVLGSISEQSIAGAICTGTHSTGVGASCLADLMEKLVLVTSVAPFVMTCSRAENADLFEAAGVSSGVLGIIVQVTLRVERSFRMEYRQWTIERSALAIQLPALIEVRHDFFLC